MKTHFSITSFAIATMLLAHPALQPVHADDMAVNSDGTMDAILKAVKDNDDSALKQIEGSLARENEDSMKALRAEATKTHEELVKEIRGGSPVGSNGDVKDATTASKDMLDADLKKNKQQLLNELGGSLANANPDDVSGLIDAVAKRDQDKLKHELDEQAKTASAAGDHHTSHDEDDSHKASMRGANGAASGAAGTVEPSSAQHVETASPSKAATEATSTPNMHATSSATMMTFSLMCASATTAAIVLLG